MRPRGAPASRPCAPRSPTTRSTNGKRTRARASSSRRSERGAGAASAPPPAPRSTRLCRGSLYPATSRGGSTCVRATGTSGEVPVEGLADKVVLVTGGSSGIGEACARRLAVEGCAVMVAGRDEAKTRAVAESLLPQGKHGWVTGDVREVGDCRALVTAAMDRYGQLDVLVHCAGVWDERPTLDVSEEDWDGVVDTCLKGAFFTMQAAPATPDTTGSPA